MKIRYDRISLEEMEFFAYHGVYAEEQKIGNKYRVDLVVWADLSQAALSDSIKHTINYEKLYRLTQEEINKPAKLLEHIAHRIIQRVLSTYPFIAKVRVSVAKNNPPIGGVCAWARVYMERKNPALNNSSK